MKKWSLRKKLTLPLLVLVPILVYGLFELNSLTSDEEALKGIYQRQMDAVLFSIDQYSSYEVRSWTNDLDMLYGTMSNDSLYGRLVENDPVFRALYIRNENREDEEYLGISEDYHSAAFQRGIDSLFNSSKALFSRLIRYKETGFQKLEVTEETFKADGKELGFKIFVIGRSTDIRLCIYLFDTEVFVEHHLVPKFQQIAQDQFTLVCRRSSDGTELYATSSEVNEDLYTQSLTSLPQYELGIAPKGGTIELAVAKRKQQNLISLGLLLLFLFFGLSLVFRNIRKEVELAENKADFVSNVSHEIRTPLALINMFAETLLMDRVRTEEKKKEYYEIITKEVGRLSNMVNRILSFSKMEAGKRAYNKQPLSLTEVAEEVVNTYSYHLESNGFEYAFVPAEATPLIMADREALIEVMVNLIDNAMKYSEQQKQVSVKTGVENEMVYVEIKDHGIGIARAQQSKLFEKFYRVPKGDVHEVQGAGLGLSIVKQIVDAHGGKILVESKQGEGSTFRLLFPEIDNENG
jgi:two-component system phosphate regulon sensor histidine kinase PhoR